MVAISRRLRPAGPLETGSMLTQDSLARPPCCACAHDATIRHAVLYRGSTQLCQTAISFQTVTANNQLCLINNGGAGNPQINSGSGSVSFPAGNTVVVNPAAPQATVQNIIQVSPGGPSHAPGALADPACR